MTIDEAKKISEKTEPKFKIGQIVMMKSLKKPLPFKILGLMWEDGWFYQWNKKNYAAEYMLRGLTPEEKGVGNYENNSRPYRKRRLFGR